MRRKLLLPLATNIPDEYLPGNEPESIAVGPSVTCGQGIMPVTSIHNQERETWLIT
jgi:hypothetical protein